MIKSKLFSMANMLLCFYNYPYCSLSHSYSSSRRSSNFSHEIFSIPQAEAAIHPWDAMGHCMYDPVAFIVLCFHYLFTCLSSMYTMRSLKVGTMSSIPLYL